MIQVGQRMKCALLESDGNSFVPVGKTVPVEVREIKGNSVRVKVLRAQKHRFMWVQRGMLKDA